MATSYRVVAPYVTLKVKDTNGKDVIVGYYDGAVVTDDQVDAESLKHHLDSGMVEKVEDAPAEAPAEPKEPTAKEILDEVGDDRDKAAAALEAEQAKGDKARSTLVAKLEAIVTNP